MSAPIRTAADTRTVVIDADVLGRRRTGDETYVSGLLRELGALAASPVRVVATTRFPHLVPPGIEAIRLPARSQAARVGVALPWRLRRAGADLAHFQYVVPPAWSGHSVVTVHDLAYDRHPEFFEAKDSLLLRALVPRAVRRSARVFTVSEFSRRDLVERYRLDPDKVVVTPNGLDPAFGQDGPRRDGPPYLLFVGAIQPRKDPVCAVRALRRLDPDLHLIMAGPPKTAVPDLEPTISRLGLVERVHLLGHVTTPELAALYRGAACLVFPSRYEGFGLPALEAMASATPVVAADTGALPEVVDGAGIVFPAGDDEALADGVRTALANRERLVAAGLQRASQYRWADVAARTLATYLEVLDG